MKINFSIPAVLLCIFFSCTRGISNHENKVTECVDSFAIHYFNYQFFQTKPFVTNDSEKWLELAASNVTQSDIDILRNQEQAATIETENITFNSGDSVAIASIKVHHFLDMNNIAAGSRFVDEGSFHLTVVRNEGKWKVRMEGLPRNEKRSHD